MSLHVQCDVCQSTRPFPEATAESGWRFLYEPGGSPAAEDSTHLCSPTCITRWGLLNGAKVRAPTSGNGPTSRVRLSDMLRSSENVGIDLRSLDADEPVPTED